MKVDALLMAPPEQTQTRAEALADRVALSTPGGITDDALAEPVTQVRADCSGDDR